jgi:twitching motility protein PilT
MRVALMAADTGHLVLSTLHTANAPQTVNRILSLYPPHQHGEIRFLLASNLEAIVALRLIQRADRLGRVPACEVLLASDSVREMILDPSKTVLLPQAIADGVHTYGMRTFDQSLMDLYSRNLVTLDQAIKHASNPTEFQLRVEGIHSASGDASWSKFEKKERTGKGGEEAGTDRVAKGSAVDTPEGISRY